MLHRTAAIALAAIIAAPAQAEDSRPFDHAGFAAAQAQSLPILIDVHAWWCPVCASQARTIKRIVASGQYPKLVVFRIDYDKQKDEWRGFGARKQATLIGFHGRRETGRIQYMTDKVKIAELIASTQR